LQLFWVGEAWSVVETNTRKIIRRLERGGWAPKHGGKHYVGNLDGKAKVWGVRIPDVPGCYGGGPTPEVAIADATSALAELISDGLKVRAPRSILEVLGDPAVKLDTLRGDTLVLIAAPVTKRRKTRVPA
jgi:predicted RNase H-like HicB family nuclease